ncbi:hypothetical protein NDI45_11710 [Leptolyngbya sp. GB1-A1]|uniref:hypothetical protein n=1 Tax=Leptolyngbya sp. GB1-A1 TaxID=2933908 RepID=UPI003297267B
MQIFHAHLLRNSTSSQAISQALPPGHTAAIEILAESWRNNHGRETDKACALHEEF